MKSPGLKSEKKFKEQAVRQGISEELANATFFYQDRARKAFEQRETNWEFFDGMPYYQDYILNRQSANTYLRPKKNDDEVRINTGVTEKKIEVVYNELLSLNLEPECRTYDRNDNFLKEVGDQWTDVVIRTNEIEKDDDFWQDAYLELLTQRAVYIKDVWDTPTVRDKRADGRVLERTLPQARKVLVSGLKIFLGNIRLPWYRFKEQPFFVEYDRVHWKTAEAMFKYDKEGNENPMWKYVGKGNPTTNDIFSFRYGVLQDDEVEILTYKSYPDDEIMHIVQGVPMDKVGTKLPWEYEGYNMKMFGLKRMSTDFAYCKPLTASAKTLQSLDNESIRLVVRKWRQALEPPMGVKTGKVMSKDIWSPSAMIPGITADDFSILNPDNKGITSGDHSMMQWIEEKTKEFIGAGDLQAGLETTGQQTATEIRQLQKQFIIQLGGAVIACMAMRRDMAELRTYTLLENATQPIGKDIDPVTEEVIDVYRKFTREEADLGDGRIGRKEILFMDRDLSEDEKVDIDAYEEDQEDMGKDVRLFTLNVKKLLSMPLNWYWTVTQSQKDSAELDKIIFGDTLNQAAGISKLTGRPLSPDTLVRDFEQIHKKKDWFDKAAPAQIQPADQLEEEGSPAGGQMKPKIEEKPSLNSLNEA